MNIGNVSSCTASIKNINFVENWKGLASDELLNSLTEYVSNTDILCSNLQTFSTILNKVEQLISIDNKINDLKSQLSGLDEEEDSGLISSIQAEINKLQVERTNLKNEIIAMLDSLVGAVSANKIADVSNVVSYTSNTSFDGDKDVIRNTSQWTGPKLDAKMGFLENGPSGSETFCPDPVSQIVKNMGTIYGYTNLKDSIRDDGVRVLSGTTPDGQNFEDLVIVAADVTDAFNLNPDGIYDRGDIVETSLGTGIVIDLCGRSQNMRRVDGSIHYDIYTAWHDADKRWYWEIYGDDK